MLYVMKQELLIKNRHNSVNMFEYVFANEEADLNVRVKAIHYCSLDS